MTVASLLPEITRVAVIGAGGVSGLTSLAQLLDKGVSADKIVGFEARDVAGGVWNHETPGSCDILFREDGLPAARSKEEIVDGGIVGKGQSAVYDGLSTNLPATVMALRNRPFPEGTPLFPRHYQVKDYLQSYARDLGLNALIRFNTIVRSVRSAAGADYSQGWEVVSETRADDGSVATATEHFSHIMICNGHYAEPYIPYLPGLWTFPGQVIHSRWWRSPAQFDGQTVLVVGSHASGSDVCRELAVRDEALVKEGVKVTRRIVQSVRAGAKDAWVEDDKLGWIKRIEVVAEVERAEGGVLVLKNGGKLEGVDVIVFATGYLYSFPFCPADAHPFAEFPLVEPVTAPAHSTSRPPHGSTTSALRPPGGTRILNLDPADLFYAPNPTLAFIAIYYNTNPFPLPETEARVIAHAWRGRRVPALPPLGRLTADPADRNVGSPQEFDNADAWLEAIGEGGDGGRGGWARTSEEKRKGRTDALRLRKEVLGY